MELSIRGRNLEIDDQIRRHVETKLGHLGRQLPGLSGVAVELASEPTRTRGDRFVAQVTLNVGGSILRAEQRASSHATAINSAAEVLARRIERYKSQTYRSERARHNVSLGIQQADEAEQADGGPLNLALAEGSVVRVKRFAMEPMSVNEAAFQMQLLGHQFYVFLNKESGTHNVLYQRSAGDFGLIQPE